MDQTASATVVVIATNWANWTTHEPPKRVSEVVDSGHVRLSGSMRFKTGSTVSAHTFFVGRLTFKITTKQNKKPTKTNGVFRRNLEKTTHDVLPRLRVLPRETLPSTRLRRGRWQRPSLDGIMTCSTSSAWTLRRFRNRKGGLAPLDKIPRI